MIEQSTIILIVIALVAANSPFFIERILFVFRPKQRKHPAWILLELFTLYFVVGGLGYLMESRLGVAHRQRWEFYAITASLFLVLAYPGFVYRYLWRKK